MTDKGLGQYDTEYANCSCFWGDQPGKYVKRLTEILKKGDILDLGCGEGKNALYLAKLGFDVVAIDCSKYAIQNFNRRVSFENESVKSKIEILNTDVVQYFTEKKYDAVIAYGLLHCLKNKTDYEKVLENMKFQTKQKGYNVIVAFTDTLPIPEVQRYLDPTLVSEGFIREQYKDWDVLYYENEIIEETHPTTNTFHKHSICRMLARKK